MDQQPTLTEAPAVAFSGVPHVEGGRRWLLLCSLFVCFFMLLALYCGVLAVLLPNQIATLDPAHKVENLGLMFFVTSIFSTLTTPIAGAFSDRTRSKWGRRTPWIVAGSVIGAVALASVAYMPTFWTITAVWVVAAIALNSMQPALTTVVADRFPEHARGTASGFVGAGMTAGGTVGMIVAGRLANNMPLAYAVFAAAIAICCVAFVFLNHDTSSKGEPLAKLRAGDFARGFWIDPKTYPDFWWAFAGRFTIYMGYQAIVTYLLYILQDYIGLGTDQANIVIGTVSAITFVCVMTSSFLSGVLSDWIKRRKPFVFAASIIMGAALIVPLVMPNLEGMYGYAALIGIGYGAFMSIDMALMTQVLPKDTGEAGKDLGLLTTAVNIPQIISPVMAAQLLKYFNTDYRILFIAALVFVFAGSFFVLPIKSVK